MEEKQQLIHYLFVLVYILTFYQEIFKNNVKYNL